MTTTNLSNERLEEIRDYDTCVTFAESAEMARELLALREAAEKPVATMHRLVNKRNGDEHPWVCSVGVRHSSEGDIFRVEVQYLYADPPAPVVPEWTNEQCLEFLSVAFRHNSIEGDIELDDIRLGVKMANAAVPKTPECSEVVSTIKSAPTLDSSPDQHIEQHHKGVG